MNIHNTCTSLGNWLLPLELGIIGISIILSLRPVTSKNILLSAAITQSLGLSLIVGVLMYAFLSSDFSLWLVATHSSKLMPFGYKISALWASTQGSLLLWLLFLSVSSTIAFYRIRSQPEAPKFLAIQLILIGSFLFLLYGYNNPFLRTPLNLHEGFGLNPVLQDQGLIWHPPVLYLGYALSSIGASYCLIYLFTHNIALLEHSLVFSRSSWLCLTGGVVLGSCWAYRSLGWGGFWAFDPVENISLLPWLAATAFQHSLLIAIKQRKLLRWTVVLGILTFLLTLVSILLVRSGLLVSLHAFTEGGRYVIYLMTIVSICLLSYSSILTYKINEIPVRKSKALSLVAKDFGITIGNITWLICIAILASATLYPVIYKLYSDKVVVVEEGFFSYFTFMMLLVAVQAGSFAYFKPNQRTYNLKIIGIHLSLIALTIGITWYFTLGILMGFALYGAGSLLVTSTCLLVLRSNWFRIGLKPSSLAFIFGHLSYGLITLSIAINIAFKQEIIFHGVIGSKQSFGKFDITLNDVRYTKGANYYRELAELEIEDHGKVTILKPEYRFYPTENMLTSESSIYSTLWYDLYAVLNNSANQQDSEVRAIIYYQPAIGMLRLSALILVVSILLSIIGPIIQKSKPLQA